MNISLFLLVGLFGLTDNIHNVWDNVDYEDVTLTEFTSSQDLLDHNKTVGINNIPEINIYSDEIRKEYQGPCVVLGWASNTSVYVYHIESNKFLIV